MNLKNLEYLKEGLKYMGFGEGLNEKLSEQITKQVNEFQLNTINEYAGNKIKYSLDFRKSDKSDMYFFNKYTATIKEGEPDEKKQTFYVKKNSGITAKEAYNLLNGRAVNKDLTSAEGQQYNAWLQIDWKQTDNNGNHKYKMVHEGYGFNLEKELTKLPIKEVDQQVTKERILQSLERGNLHQVTFVKLDKEDKMFIEANPQFKTINVYDSALKKVFRQSEKNENKVDKEPTQNPEQKQEEQKEEKKKEEQKKEVKQSPDEESSNKGKKTFKRPKQSV